METSQINQLTATLQTRGFFKIRLASASDCAMVFGNTRAVPLVRKDDAHEGRVFLLSLFGALQEGAV
jgi:hypothetical protein